MMQSRQQEYFQFVVRLFVMNSHGSSCCCCCCFGEECVFTLWPIYSYYETMHFFQSSGWSAIRKLNKVNHMYTLSSEARVYANWIRSNFLTSQRSDLCMILHIYVSWDNHTDLYKLRSHSNFILSQYL